MLDRYFYTYHNPAGDRLARGRGTFPNVATVDVELRGSPLWAVGYAMETAVWHVVLDGGDLQVVEVTPDGEARTLAFESGWFKSAQPPVVGVSMIEGAYVLRSDASVSPLSHPIPVNDFEALYINTAGDLVLGREEGIVASLPIMVPPYARMVMNRRGQVALYANATDRAPIEDGMAARALLIVRARDGQLEILTRTDLPGDDFYCGISPFWADIDGDGIEDLVTTVSREPLGERMRVHLWDGAGIWQEVDGPPMEPGKNWRQPFSAGAFGFSGQIEIAAMSMSSAGGAVEFFRYVGDSLKRTAGAPGFTNIVARSRSLDQTAAGDFNGNGRLEVLALDASRPGVVAVERSAMGAEQAWRLDAGAEITSNFAPVELLDGRLGLAVGTADDRLRVWLPSPAARPRNRRETARHECSCS
ncbi:MAG: hypothetical protein OXG23_01280 [Chloroflexi bacterium]|nr:hypothetical protein [Chloroflexota bacterium]